MFTDGMSEFRSVNLLTLGERFRTVHSFHAIKKLPDSKAHSGYVKTVRLRCWLMTWRISQTAEITEFVNLRRQNLRQRISYRLCWVPADREAHWLNFHHRSGPTGPRGRRGPDGAPGRSGPSPWVARAQFSGLIFQEVSRHHCFCLSAATLVEYVFSKKCNEGLWLPARRKVSAIVRQHRSSFWLSIRRQASCSCKAAQRFILTVHQKTSLLIVNQHGSLFLILTQNTSCFDGKASQKPFHVVNQTTSLLWS